MLADVGKLHRPELSRSTISTAKRQQTMSSRAEEAPFTVNIDKTSGAHMHQPALVGISIHHFAVEKTDPEVEQSVTLTDGGDYIFRLTPKRFLKDIRNFEVRSTDIFVISWPRSGSTWTQYMVTQIVHGLAFMEKHNLHTTNIFMEAAQDVFKLDTTEGTYRLAERRPSPRLLKSHLQMKYLPYQLFTKKPKIIYAARNPKDAAVSYYNYTEMNNFLPNYRDWNDFFQHSIRYVPCGDWFSHVLPWWELRDEPNVLFLKYEDTIKDTKGTVLKISEFLERPLSPNLLDEISRKSTFSEMSRNRNVNYDLMKTSFFKSVVNGVEQKFMRKGTIGDWRNYFTLAQNDHFDELYQAKLRGTGLTFDFEQLQSVL